MPTGSGHTVEAQITGEEFTAGIQFEITPEAPYQIYGLVKEVCGAEVAGFDVWSWDSIAKIRSQLGLGDSDRLWFDAHDLTFLDGPVSSIITKTQARELIVLSLQSPPKRSRRFYSRQRLTQICVLIDESTTPIKIDVPLDDTVSDLKFLI